MQIQIGNSLLLISWQHNRINPETGREYKKRWTKCTIRIKVREDVKEGESKYDTIAEGIAKCYKSDAYSKCLGRKLSLTKALENLKNDPTAPIFLSKEDKQAIWVLYTEKTTCGFEVSPIKERVVKKPQEDLLEGAPNYIL